MQTSGVDSRDVAWDDDSPTYRVYMWHRPDPPAGIDEAVMGYWCDEHRLVNASDVHEVLGWAEANVPVGDTFTLYVESGRGVGIDGRPGLLRLAGTDPTAPTL